MRDIIFLKIRLKCNDNLHSVIGLISKTPCYV